MFTLRDLTVSLLMTVGTYFLIYGAYSLIVWLYEVMQSI